MKTSMRLILASLSVVFQFAVANAAPKTVAHVDLKKYAGTWYQSAHIPMIFEGRKPCACARQVLTPLADGSIEVYNSCNEGDAAGALKDIKGKAYNDDPATNAKFTVDFGLPWKGTYWIVGLDPKYRYAVVTDKDGKSLYILSKTPELDPALYNEAVSIARQQSLRVDKMTRTDHKDCQYP